MSSEEQAPAQTLDAPVEPVAEDRPLSRKTATFPHLPGVYLFKDAEGTVLYVGKALDLRKRVGSYFRNTATTSVKTRVLVSRSADLEFVVTSTEKEALAP